jgi:16S rRNA (adenine1518-N6/adenine1519-N6)-dimethyltransferase
MPWRGILVKNNNYFRQKHSLGQHFISDEALLESLVSASGVGPDDNILEIGPGTGNMTGILAARCKHVLALEIDERLLPILRVSFEKEKNVTFIAGDVMQVDLCALMAPYGPFHIVANLPYYITTPLLTMLLKSRLPIESINIMLQKEAAERLVAIPGTRDYGPLAMRAGYSMILKIAANISADYFAPRPKVDSAFVTMKKRESPAVSVKNEELMFKIISAAFSMRRKTLINNLTVGFGISRISAINWVSSCGLDITVRGESLAITAYASLADHYPGNIPALKLAK